MNFQGSSLISVVITCYNQERYINKAVESVINQTFSNWECIIVDDGSTDNSVNIINTFCIKDKRIIFLRQENQGVAKARNNGFQVARGEFIQFLDGDDTLLPEKFEQQFKHFKENPDISVSISGFQHYFVNKGLYETYTYEQINEYPLDQLIYKWPNSVSFPPHAAIYRKNIWAKNGNPFQEDYTHRSEDWVFNILLALKGIKYSYLNKVLCNYHIYDSNFTSDSINNSVSFIQAAFYLLDKIPQKYQDKFIENTVKKSFDRYLKNKTPEILHASGNWKLGNFITRPFFILINFYTRLFH